MINEAWVESALCREVDPELFFPDGRGAQQTSIHFRQAVSVCQKCPVRSDCYSYAYENDIQYGVWGGHFAWQIRRAKRKGIK